MNQLDRTILSVPPGMPVMPGHGMGAIQAAPTEQPKPLFGIPHMLLSGAIMWGGAKIAETLFGEVFKKSGENTDAKELAAMDVDENPPDADEDEEPEEEEDEPDEEEEEDDEPDEDEEDE